MKGTDVNWKWLAGTGNELNERTSITGFDRTCLGSLCLNR